ncbi:MAG: hypothetical protein QS2022_0810 [Candidatus Phytoplasma asteris]|nr:MAG: hypothetical protein PLY_0800 [Periwinkle leaf yellowing phytoplasma]WEX19371.1 MAG: hypothetical protein QS2022_0810 [Candidatus Phytoplasma asteris]
MKKLKIKKNYQLSKKIKLVTHNTVFIKFFILSCVFVFGALSAYLFFKTESNIYKYLEFIKSLKLKIYIIDISAFCQLAIDDLLKVNNIDAKIKLYFGILMVPWGLIFTNFIISFRHWALSFQSFIKIWDFIICFSFRFYFYRFCPYSLGIK